MPTPTKTLVYLATNRRNRKRYIGVTSLGLELRRYKHEWEAQKGRAHCRRFHHAIRFHGPDTFEWSILSSFDRYEDALAEEVRLIASQKPEYNLTKGGQGPKGRSVSAEQRARHSAFMKGRRLSPESIAKIVAKNRGKKRTLEQRARIAAGKRGKPFTAEHCLNISKAKRRQALQQRRKEGQLALEI